MVSHHPFRTGLCIGTTCTVASRTSLRNKFSTDPRSKISHRDRTGCPNATCEMLSCWANRFSGTGKYR